MDNPFSPVPPARHFPSELARMGFPVGTGSAVAGEDGRQDVVYRAGESVGE